MRLQSVVHANRRLKEVPYGDHAVSLEEHVRTCAALRSSSPPVCMAECVEFKGWVSRCDPPKRPSEGCARDHCFPLFRLARFTI